MRRRLLLGLALTISTLGLGASPAPARGGEIYYMIIFGSEREVCPKPLQYTHTWATFVRTVGEGPDPSTYAVVESFTISWLPATLKVRVPAAHGEPGVNLDTYSTLAYVRNNGESVWAWGPYVVGPLLYARALDQYGVLQRKEILYRAIDTAFDPRVSDCIHAVSAIDPEFGRGHYPLIRVGRPASRHIAQNFFARTLVDQTSYDTRWLIARLQLDGYPITWYRSITAP